MRIGVSDYRRDIRQIVVLYIEKVTCVDDYATLLVMFNHGLAHTSPVILQTWNVITMIPRK